MFAAVNGLFVVATSRLAGADRDRFAGLAHVYADPRSTNPAEALFEVMAGELHQSEEDAKQDALECAMAEVESRRQGG
ncbi:hypothetical protein [Ramlibacter sp.]|uniref:hypothetical protein n=1 Tax=Ramlibacter sp. TaxID=1917967 RepID=UPI003D0EC60F